MTKFRVHLNADRSAWAIHWGDQLLGARSVAILVPTMTVIAESGVDPCATAWVVGIARELVVDHGAAAIIQ